MLLDDRSQVQSNVLRSNVSSPECSLPSFQVLELQNTLDDLTHRVDAVKEENLKLRSENTVLGQYIENLMQASAVFQAVSPKTGRKERTSSALMT